MERQHCHAKKPLAHDCGRWHEDCRCPQPVPEWGQAGKVLPTTQRGRLSIIPRNVLSPRSSSVRHGSDRGEHGVIPKRRGLCGHLAAVYFSLYSVLITANNVSTSQNVLGASSQPSKMIGSTSVPWAKGKRTSLLSTVTVLALKHVPEILSNSSCSIWAPCTERRWQSDPAHSPELPTSQSRN